jgi:enterochelin esterase family protein
MKITLIICTLLMVCSMAVPQSFERFVDRVNKAPDFLKMGIVDSFMNQNLTSPFLEGDNLAYILIRGNFNKINFSGDINQWDRTADQFSRIEGTNLWFYKVVLESDARIDYQIILNDSLGILDPLNPNIIRGGFGPNSELRMSAYLPAPEIDYYENIPHGSLIDTNFYSISLQNSRGIKIYLPPDYLQSDEKYALVVFHDGPDYLRLGNAQNILDYLIWKRRIEPVIAIFIPAVNRSEEYSGNLKEAYAQFIVHEMIRWVDHKYRIKENPAARITIGASGGGNISLWLGLQYPEVFGSVAAQSSYAEESVFEGFEETSHTGTKFYLDMGLYDVPLLPPLVDNLVRILEEKKISYQYCYYSEGHSWGNWRAHIDDALEMLIPGPSSIIESDSKDKDDP